MTAPHRTKSAGRRLNTVNHLSMAVLLGEMVDGSFTTRSLMEESGLSRTTVYRLVRAFHTNGVIHVTGWDKDAAGRVCLPVYTLGRGRDVKRKAKTRAEINRDYTERQRLKLVADAMNERLATALNAANDSGRPVMVAPRG